MAHSARKDRKQNCKFSFFEYLKFGVFVCLFQIDTWCKENKYVIAGYYQANERIKDAR